MKYLFINSIQSKKFEIGYFNGKDLKILKSDDIAKDFLTKLKELNTDIIDEIIFTKGPGSYTSLRIAASYALGLSISKKIKLKAISFWDLIFNEFPDYTIYFYTGTKKWIKKTINNEEIITKNELDFSVNWISNCQNLMNEHNKEFPSIIKLMLKHKKMANEDLNLIYPKII